MWNSWEFYVSLRNGQNYQILSSDKLHFSTSLPGDGWYQFSKLIRYFTEPHRNNESNFLFFYSHHSAHNSEKNNNSEKLFCSKTRSLHYKSEIILISLLFYTGSVSYSLVLGHRKAKIQLNLSKKSFKSFNTSLLTSRSWTGHETMIVWIKIWNYWRLIGNKKIHLLF